MTVRQRQKPVENGDLLKINEYFDLSKYHATTRHDPAE